MTVLRSSLAGVLSHPGELAASRSLPATSARLSGIDAARALAAVGVVWMHTCSVEGWNRLGDFRNPFFIIVSMMLITWSMLRKNDHSFVDFASKRISRLYMPFIAWSLIYLVVFALVGHAIDIAGEIRPAFFVRGTHLFLWFIPFLTVASLLAYGIVRVLVSQSAKSQIVVAAAMVVAGLAAACAIPMSAQSFYIYGGLPRWACSIPDIAVGVGIGVLLFHWKPRESQKRWLTPLFLVMWMAALGLTVVLPSVTLAIVGIAGGLSLLLASLWMPGNALVSKLATLAPYGMGCYLSHGLILELSRDYKLFEHWAEPVQSLTRFGFVLVAAFTVARLLHMNRFTRWLV